MDYANLALLAEKAQAGDTAAMSELYTETYNKMYFFTLKIVGNEQDALDVLQNAYIIMVEKLKSLKDPQMFIAWFKRVLINECNQSLKKNKKYVQPDDKKSNMFDSIPDENEEFLPESVLNDSETQRIIFDTIDNELSNIQKQTVMMFYYDELKISDIAKITETNENTVKNRLHESRKKLKNALLVYKKQGMLVVVPLPLLTALLRQLAEKNTLSPQVAETLLQTVSKATGVSLAFGTGAVTSGAAGAAGTSASGMASGASAGAASTGTAGAVGTTATTAVGLAAKIAAMSVTAKIISGIVSLVLIVGGIFGLNSLHKDSDSAQILQPDIATEISADIQTDTSEQIKIPKTPSRQAELISSGQMRDIPFGAYEWRVLAQEDDKALLITENIIDLRAYNNSDDAVTWANCSLREYLSEEFFNSFSADEQAQIVENLDVNRYEGNDIYDKVFILSIDEAERYFKDNADRDAKLQISSEQVDDAAQRMANSPHSELTSYGEWQRIIGKMANDGKCTWCLRSSDFESKFVTEVINGTIYKSTANSGAFADNILIGVRPAVWISLSKQENET